MGDEQITMLEIAVRCLPTAYEIEVGDVRDGLVGDISHQSVVDIAVELAELLIEKVGGSKV